MKKFIFSLAAIIVLGILIVPRVMEAINKTDEAEEVSVITVGGMQVISGDIASIVELIGDTESEDTVNVMAPMNAKVEEIAVSVGDYVNEGDVLIILDRESVEDQVTQAEIGVTLAEVGVANAQAAVNQAKLAYNSSKSNYEMQLDSYEFSQDNLDNYEQLLAEGVVSQTEYDQVKLQSSEETLNILDIQLDQASAALSQAELGVSSARASLRQAQESYDSAAELLNDMTITAPISGYITGSYVTENNYATSTTPVVVIQNIDSIIVNASVTENLIDRIEIGDQVNVTVEALDDKIYTGTVKTLSEAASQSTLLFPISVEVANEDHRIKPGMFVTVDIVRAESVNTLYVPSEAVVLRDGESFLYILKGTDGVVRVSVETGIDNGYYTEILDGIASEDIIITKGMGLIDEDSTIKVIRSDI